MIRRLLLIVALATGAGACGSPESSEPSYEPLPSDVAAVFDAQRQGFGAPGVAVAVWQNGTIRYAQGLGFKDPDQTVPLDPTTLFRIGSVTKMMTAAVVLQKVQAGTLQLDDHVASVLGIWQMPANPAWSQQITVENLITHQGGFFDYTPLDGDRDDASLRTWVDDELTQYYMMAPPGEFWNYANPNFAVAGAVAEAVDSGRYYPEIIRDDVWRPLGMKRTYLHAEDVLADGDYATAVSATPGYDTGVLTPDSYDLAGMRPAGFAWASPLDLVRFGAFLLEGNPSVLDDSLRQAMSAEQVKTLYFLDYLHYGYGVLNERVLFAQQTYPTRLITHSGAIPGFSAELFALPDYNIAVAVLSNADGAYYGASVAQLFDALVELPAPVADPDPEINAADFAAYEGTYNDPFNIGTVTITNNAGTLTVDAPTLDQFGVPYDTTMTAISKWNFVWYVQGYPFQITFVDGSDGTTSKYLRARYFVATRPSAAQAKLREPTRTDVQRFLERVRVDAMLDPRLPGDRL